MLINLDQAGLLILPQSSLYIFEWDEDSKTLLETGLIQNEILKNAVALGVTAAADLQCQ